MTLSPTGFNNSFRQSARAVPDLAFDLRYLKCVAHVAEQGSFRCGTILLNHPNPRSVAGSNCSRR
jgi:hypothetical protein